MLVNNDWRIDSRVVREAEALARNGMDVSVVFRRDRSPEDQTEQHNGVRYICVPKKNRWVATEIFALLGVHVRVLLLDAPRVYKGPARIFAATSVLQLLLFPLAATIAFLLAPVVIPLLFARRRLPVVQKAVGYILQPLFYLDEYAVRCRATAQAIEADVVHAHDLVTLSCALLLSQAGKQRPRFIYDAHELETETNYWLLNAWTRHCVRTYERALIARAEGVITVCDSIADWLALKYRIARPAVVLNVPEALGAVGPVGGQSGSDGIRARLNLSAATPLAVYVGSVTIDRGLEFCVRALRYMPDLHLALVGPRYPDTERSIAKAARESNVENRLHLIDPVPAGRVVEFISGADCSVIAIQNVCLSYYFALPNKLFESALAGLPVVAANLLELRRFVEENHIGLIVDETDPKDIARGIKEILADADLYRPSGDKLKHIAERFGWPVQQKRLFLLYKQIMSGPHACQNLQQQ